MKQKLLVLSVLLCVMPAGGCLESFALVGAGAAGGITLERLLSQAEEDVTENIEFLETENVALEARIADSNDIAEQAKLQAQVERNLDWLDKLKAAQLTLQTGKKGLKIDWDNPEAILGFSTTIIMAVMAYLQYRKKRNAEGEYDDAEIRFEEIVAGGQAFKELLNGVDTFDREAVLTNFKIAHNGEQSPNTKRAVAYTKI